MDQPPIRGTIATRVTYLEMRAPPAGMAPPAAPPGATVYRLDRPDPATYRVLFDRAGRDWTWTARKLLSDATLARIINDPRVGIFMVTIDGAEAGFIELDSMLPGEVEISYFGIFPEYHGRKLGRFLLGWGIHHAWTVLHTERLWVHTCTLDHPAALPLYRKMGFLPYDEREETVDLI